jgi:hypothetical protein
MGSFDIQPWDGNTSQDVQVAGVGTTKTGYVIRFRDAQSAEIGRNNSGWLEELVNEQSLSSHDMAL